jgi:hypothetical protein
MLFEKDDLGFIAGRLSGTCFLHNECLHKYSSLDMVNKQVIVYSSCINVDGKIAKSAIDLEEICFGNLKLGNVNNYGRCSYVSREAERRWKQGIDIRALKTTNGAVDCFSPQFLKMLLNIYPTVKECFELPEDTEQAFSKEFCIVAKGRYYLLFKGSMVGTIKPDLSFQLEPRFQHLTEMLQERLK